MDDVVIVGAGSAGCVLADRLSARGARVIVLEAGPDAGDRAGVRASSFFDAIAEPDLLWPDVTARRTPFQEPRQYGRGRGLGGSSLVNAMVGLWGEVEDYDAWERDHGCIGWSWRHVEPYFRRIDVPLTKAETGSSTRLGAALVGACRTLGWDLHRGPYPLGGVGHDVGPAMLTRDRDGRRVSAADAYLSRARARPNVTVRANTVVDRILLEGRRSRGVVLADGSEVRASTVVVCAGAIHSPAILLRSGVDRPGIGFGLQDHPSAPITVAVNEPVEASQLAVTSLARFSSGESPADLQILPMDHLGPAAPGYGVLSVALMEVRSRGRVQLRSSDPHEDPAVDFGLLGDDTDRRRLMVGIRVLRSLLQEPTLAAAITGAFIDDRGTRVDELGDDDDALTDWMQRHVGDYVHAAGTCAMGDPHRESSVVDPSGAVIGYEGLRVCDASIFPRLPRANTHFPVMMAAEVLADRWS